MPASKYEIWPWYPWYPWRDCNPDVLFHVTQPCGGDFKVIVDQGYSQTQWDIPTSYNVTLVANNDACCAEDTTPCGDPCLSITHVCDIHRSAVDQTTGSATAGLAYPGAASGLNAENVTQAVSTLHPFGVDVASGVESKPAKKDYEKMRRFIETVRRADVALIG